MTTTVKEAAVKKEDLESQPAPAAKLPEPYINPFLYQFLFVLGTLIYSSYTILVHLTEVNGHIPWSSASMVLITEVTKLGLSVGMFMPELSASGWKVDWPPLRAALAYAIPAVLYAFNNNLAVYIQLQMDPASYQILGNLKILTTAFLFRAIIRKPISPLQWGALGILFLAGVTNSLSSLSREHKTSAVLHITPAGLIMVCTYCTVSGLAGVYTEYVLKKQASMSIHLQNSLLYTFGIAVNAATFSVQAWQRSDHSFDLLRGFTFLTWVLVFSQAVGGIIMGVIMKFASNISKLFLVSAAMILTTILSMLIFGLKLNVYFALSFVMVVTAQYLYNK